jgi:hypothetical protein
MSGGRRTQAGLAGEEGEEVVRRLATGFRPRPDPADALRMKAESASASSRSANAEARAGRVPLVLRARFQRPRRWPRTWRWQRLRRGEPGAAAGFRGAGAIGSNTKHQVPEHRTQGGVRPDQRDGRWYDRVRRHRHCGPGPGSHDSAERHAGRVDHRDVRPYRRGATSKTVRTTSRSTSVHRRTSRASSCSTSQASSDLTQHVASEARWAHGRTAFVASPLLEVAKCLLCDELSFPRVDATLTASLAPALEQGFQHVGPPFERHTNGMSTASEN